jgi:hypothetical protein
MMTIPVDPQVLAKEHQDWLKDVPGQLAQITDLKLQAALRGQWWTQEDFNAWDEKFSQHYNSFDRPSTQQMIWRFTSAPMSEFISVKLGTSIQEIIEVIGKHSGGDDKTNENVKTSSFCRNIGAFMGTAASAGGDKKVLKIILRAEYLCGINIATLADHGISAHPALARAISAFETEYVLVPTPGNAPISIGALATVLFQNPFKELFGPDGKAKNYGITIPIANQKQFLLILNTPPKNPIVIEKNVGLKGKLDDMGASWVKEILAYARKASSGATRQSGTVQNKESANINTIQNAMKQYVSSLQAKSE